MFPKTDLDWQVYSLSIDSYALSGAKIPLKCLSDASKCAAVIRPDVATRQGVTSPGVSERILIQANAYAIASRSHAAANP